MLPLLVATAAAVLLALPAAAPAAKTRIAVGMGDQSPNMFNDASFQALKVKKVRYFIPWNAIDNADALSRADEYLRNARAANVRVLFHLDGVFTGSAPSVAQYRTKVRELVRRYRGGSEGRAPVVEWGVWNEANSRTQPVFRLAGRTAKYFLALRSTCRGCTIVALDLLDAGNIRGFINSFYRALPRSKRRLANIVGMHNYGDTNRKNNNTRLIINAVRRHNRRAQFWMTETGGIALLQSERNGRLVQSRGLGCNPANPRSAERRQAKAVGKMFRLARKYRRYVKRLYPYNFFATDCDRSLRFDAGIVRRDGSRRPAYNTLRNAMRNFLR